MHTGRMPRKEGGRGRGDVSTGQRTPKVASKPPKARGEARKTVTPVALRRD